MNATRAMTSREASLVEEALSRIVGDLSMVADRELTIGSAEVSMTDRRLVGDDVVHVSFRLGVVHGATRSQGALILPLPAALALAGYLLMMSDEAVEARMGWSAPDSVLKEAMREMNQFIRASVESAVGALGFEDVELHADGCQGVRANVRPALDYTDGDPLVTAWAEARLHDLAPFRMGLMLPPIDVDGETA